jgi:hypothetical protein
MQTASQSIAIYTYTWQFPFGAMDLETAQEARRLAPDFLKDFRRADARGVQLLDDFMVALRRRDTAKTTDERYQIAAEDLEPIFEILREVGMDQNLSLFICIICIYI